MSEQTRRAAPVKMIWMFITLGLAVSWMVTMIFLRGGFRNVTNAIETIIPAMILASGAAVCLVRGTLNLALPGTAALCACVATLIARNGGSLIGGIIASLVLGTALGALNGVFAIQSRKKAALVTGISSLILGFGLSCFTNAVADYSAMRIELDRTVYYVILYSGFAIAAAVCILGGIGKHTSPETGADEDSPSGGVRFLWTMIAGSLAGLSAIAFMVRMRGYSPSSYSNYNEFYILPILLLAGALIPNLRRSTAEAVFGMVSVVLAALGFGFVNMYMMVMSMDPNIQRVVMVIFVLLMMIPNILIGRGRKQQPEPQPAPGPEPGKTVL